MHRQKAVWPSTGNYCRGGAYDSHLLACKSVAILPEGMSKERFDWLRTVAGEVIATPGTESNVKEIYDKVHELRSTRDDVVIFNQFEEFGNYLWHYEITGSAIEEVAKNINKNGKFVDDGKKLLDDHIQREELWACTTCNACVEACPVLIDPLSIIFEMRRFLVMEQSSAPSELNVMMTNVENNAAPWAYNQADRLNWAKE